MYVTVCIRLTGYGIARLGIRPGGTSGLERNGPMLPIFFVPLHVVHLDEWCPEVKKYLGLPPGWRFLIAEGHEDVWFDESLLTA